MHEFVLSGKPMKKELGLATLDLAKRLLDFGFHPPTVYFPLLVEEALMIEPTETETKESLDAFADAIEQILAEAEDDPEIAKQAPYTTPVRRLDEVKATAQAGRPSQPALGAESASATSFRAASCFSSSTGAKRSPCSLDPLSTSPASKTSESASSLSAARSTSSQVTGVETVGRSRARRE